MPDIKTKPKNELKIKKFDGATIYKQKLKNNLVSINSKTNNIKNASNEENNEIDYGTNQIEEKSKIITNRGIDAFNKYGQKSVLKTKNNIQIAQNRINKKAENNNNGGKYTNIITKINDTISKVLGDFPPVVQTIAKIVVFGGLILLIAKAIGYIFPVIVNVLFNLLVKIVGFCILAAFLYGCWYEVKLQMTRDENSFLLNERLKYQKKEYEERERRRQERDNRR